jgi:hypothetical protein
MFSGAPLPAKIVSMNAYSARPIARRSAGAGVITGRCVDSRLRRAADAHEFGGPTPTLTGCLRAVSRAPDRVRRPSVGGLFTDWDQVPGWDNMGFPIVECRADGRS